MSFSGTNPFWPTVLCRFTDFGILGIHRYNYYSSQHPYAGNLCSSIPPKESKTRSRAYCRKAGAMEFRSSPRALGPPKVDYERRSTMQNYDYNYIPNITCQQVCVIFSNSRNMRKMALLLMSSSRL